ncbi:outer membrane protein transport protein [Cellulophaga sp. HaHaR_3_176]|uniref:OmpP1/FadL family transporter n=1 Tax=Cellulophaga sp. HaHaR_3_176 TaxID=1942464 RepID=UPI001C1FC3B3|nr:outer membrane protein transport protein [Cellulophaga sp. HaHaR_3_176]QWX82857.1 outer membrane protein transport protein [Cellulophaga sp. HaHaR_3_176]
MKKSIVFVITLACSFASAQNINDVLRFNTSNTQGTARYQAMSGAFGALGGDLSSLNNNPAGSAVFNNSLISFSGTNYNLKNTVTTRSGIAPRASNNNFQINQIGGVSVLKNSNPNSDWKKITLAFNYDRTQNFNSQYSAAYNTDTGIDNYFLNFAQGTPLGPLKLQNNEFIENAYLDIGASLGFADQQAFLGFFGGIIDPVDINNDNNTDYISLTKYNTVNQNYRKTTSGYNDKFTFNIASQYQENLYLGASINVHSILYDQLNELSENGYDADSEVQFSSFDNYLRTQGNAFSFSLGAIAKVNDAIRLGGSYESPTWYRLFDESSQQINSNIADGDIGFLDLNIINVYEKYTIKTPSKLTGSLALVFGTDGLLSLDYGYQDMSQAELRPESDSNFADENIFISQQLQAVSSLRLGGEYRIKQISLRGGYHYEQTPYINERIGDLNGISGGIGYSFGPSKLDMAINTYSRDINENVLSTDTAPTFSIDQKNTNVTLTYTVNF